MSSSAPRRVGIVTHVAQLSGAELALLRLCKVVDRDRFEPVVVTLADGPLVERLRDSGITTRVVPLAADIADARRGDLLKASTARQSASTMAYVPRLAKALRGLDLDIVHTHSLKADLLSVPLAPVLRAPIIWHVHDRISRDYLPSGIAWAVRTFARWVPQHVIANSHATAKTLLPLPRGWTVAYPGLEHSDFRTDRAAVAKARPVVGILGRIAPTKGQDVFLRAAAAVNRIHPEVRFRVIGTAMFGEQAFERSLRELSIELGIAHRVAFVGFAEDPGSALRELTICVHASPVPEPFGQVIVEAMAARVPTVVTDAGGASEIVHDGDHVIARLAAPGRADQIASQIVWLLENAEGAVELSGSAFESVRRRFAIEQTAAAVMAAWDKVQ